MWCEGNERQLLRLLAEREAAIISEDVYRETMAVAHRRRGGQLAFEAMEHRFLSKANGISPQDVGKQYELAKTLVRDKDDAPILAAFLASCADYLVTGDKDLLSVGRKEIINSRKALEILGKPAK